MIESAVFERVLPWLLAVFGAGLAVAGVFYAAVPCVSDLVQLFAATVNVAGIAIGFLATMKAILLGMKQSKTVRVLRQLNRWRGVLRKIRHAIVWCFLAAMGSALLLVLDPEIFRKSLYLNYVALAMWGALGGGAIGSAYLVSDILFAVVEQDDEPRQKQAAE